jgi:hypothetical protein
MNNQSGSQGPNMPPDRQLYRRLANIGKPTLDSGHESNIPLFPMHDDPKNNIKPPRGLVVDRWYGGIDWEPRSVTYWYKLCATGYEKTKEMFDTLSALCDSKDFSHEDQVHLVQVTGERIVRQVEYRVACQAMKVLEMRERRYSTERKCEGFRTEGKNLRKLIEDNCINPSQLMFTMTGSDGIPVWSIVYAIDEMMRLFMWHKHYAEITSQHYGVPLYFKGGTMRLPGDADIVRANALPMDAPAAKVQAPSGSIDKPSTPRISSLQAGTLPENQIIITQPRLSDGKIFDSLDIADGFEPEIPNDPWTSGDMDGLSHLDVPGSFDLDEWEL